MSSNTREAYIWSRLGDPEYRSEFVDSVLRNTVSAQVRALRTDRNLSQGELAELCGTSQSVVSQLENPDYGRHSLTSLRKLAAALDVGLIVQFVPFSDFMHWSTSLTPEALRPVPYSRDALKGVADAPDSTIGAPALSAQSGAGPSSTWLTTTLHHFKGGSTSSLADIYSQPRTTPLQEYSHV